MKLHQPVDADEGAKMNFEKSRQLSFFCAILDMSSMWRRNSMIAQFFLSFFATHESRLEKSESTHRLTFDSWLIVHTTKLRDVKSAIIFFVIIWFNEVFRFVERSHDDCRCHVNLLLESKHRQQTNGKKMIAEIHYEIGCHQTLKCYSIESWWIPKAIIRVRDCPEVTWWFRFIIPDLAFESFDAI